MRFSLMVTCIVAADEAQLQEKARRVMRISHSEHDEPTAFLREAPEGWIVGTADRVVEQLEALEDAGVERVMLQHLDHEDLEAVRLLGEAVIPRVSG
jgi:alkanesulfonate monooxygenase SsuD/methylene tetrahydromethanopterin reductase-like flavin-dependent oxidoreductase (luciferase family)